MRKRISSLFILFGLITISASAAILILTFYPVILEEIRYRFRRPDQDVEVLLSSQQDTSSKPQGKTVTPVDEDFGIVIPKIGANVRVIPNVDPYNRGEYQRQLTRGVAHAKGSAFPDQGGNVFIFAHASVSFYETTRYNSLFYLLNKLEEGDEIYLFYRKEKFQYRMVERKIVDPSEVEYLAAASGRQTVTLMTCWPPGISSKRLIVIGELVAF